MSAHLDWRQMANLHRPTDPALLAAEMQRLAAQGLTPRDISVALAIDIGVVLEALYGARGAA
jgi:hypothetical protein